MNIDPEMVQSIIRNIRWSARKGSPVQWYGVCKWVGLGVHLTLDQSIVLAHEGKNLPECKLLRELAGNLVRGHRFFEDRADGRYNRDQADMFVFYPPESKEGRPLSFWIGGGMMIHRKGSVCSRGSLCGLHEMGADLDSPCGALPKVDRETIERVLAAAQYLGWWDPYRREGSVREHVNSVYQDVNKNLRKMM